MRLYYWIRLFRKSLEKQKLKKNHREIGGLKWERSCTEENGQSSLEVKNKKKLSKKPSQGFISGSRGARHVICCHSKMKKGKYLVMSTYIIIPLM